MVMPREGGFVPPLSVRSFSRSKASRQLPELSRDVQVAAETADLGDGPPYVQACGTRLAGLSGLLQHGGSGQLF